MKDAEFNQMVIDDMATEDYQKDKAADIADKCAQKANAASGDQTNEKGCSKVPMKAGWCVMRELFNACPKEKQIKSEECDKAREKMQSDD